MAPRTFWDLLQPNWADYAWSAPNLPLFAPGPAADGQGPASTMRGPAAPPIGLAPVDLSSVDSVPTRQRATEGGAGAFSPGSVAPDQSGRMPGRYSPDRPDYHDYTVVNQVCPPEAQCSADEMKDQHLRFGVPGNPPWSPVESGHNYPAYDPWMGEFLAGPVKTTVSDDGMTITNKTQPGHRLHDGEVVRKLFQGPDGGWYVITRGQGNNIYPGYDLLNQWGGPKVFNKVDEQMRLNIMRHHGVAFPSYTSPPDNVPAGFD